MSPVTRREPRRHGRGRLPRRLACALLYLVLETLAGWVTVTAVATIVLIPAWLLAWPRAEARLVRLTGRPAPAVRRNSRFEVRWRDWAIVLLTPVTGFGGVALVGLGLVVPVLLITAPIRIAVTGEPVDLSFVTIDSASSQAVGALVGAAALGLGLWLLDASPRAWAGLMTSLLEVRERQLVAQVTALSDESARAHDRLDLERRQLERDLHDGAQMHLGVAGARLGMLQLEAEDYRDPPSTEQLRARIEAVREQLDAASAAMRNTLEGLVPAALDQGGLGPALEEVLAELPIATRLTCDVPRLDAATERALYFVAVEALANVVRHSGASSVEVRAGVTQHQVTLEIVDDGCGGAAPTGAGLLNIPARARLLGGEAIVDSPPGRGTTITVRVPRVDRGGVTA